MKMSRFVASMSSLLFLQILFPFLTSESEYREKLERCGGRKTAEDSINIPQFLVPASTSQDMSR